MHVHFLHKMALLFQRFGINQRCLGAAPEWRFVTFLNYLCVHGTVWWYSECPPISSHGGVRPMVIRMTLRDAGSLRCRNFIVNVVVEKRWALLLLFLYVVWFVLFLFIVICFWFWCNLSSFGNSLKMTLNSAWMISKQMVMGSLVFHWIKGMTGNCLHRQFSLTDPFVPTD